MSSTTSTKQSTKNNNSNSKRKRKQATTSTTTIEDENITRTTSNSAAATESEDEENQSTTTRDDESSLEENDEDILESDEEDEIPSKEKEQSEAVNSKLLQSRPVMFSGNQKDFLLYKRHLIILLSGCNLLEELKPKEERDKKYKSTTVTKTRTITMINSTLPQKIADTFLELFEVNDSYNLDIDPVVYWKTICNRYEKNTEINKQRIQQELAEEKLKGTEPIDDYLGRLTVHFQRLRSFGEEMKEDSKKFHILKGLPEEYKSYTQAMSLLSASMPYEDVITHLTNFQESLRAQQKKEPSEEAHLVARENKKDDHAAFIRNNNYANRGRFSNFRGSYRSRGRFNYNHNVQRREYNRPSNFKPYNRVGDSPRQAFNRGRGSYRGRGTYRGRGRGNYLRSSMQRRNDNNNGAEVNGNENNHNRNEQSNQQNQRQELVCWKCSKPGHKSMDCRN
jgi:hypothetical protein